MRKIVEKFFINSFFSTLFLLIKLKNIGIMSYGYSPSEHFIQKEEKLITNYETLYKKLLQNANKYDKMNIEDFAKEYEKEQKMPESVRGNAPWIKDLYSEIESRPITATFGTQRKNKLLSDFAKEAESIYKLDAKNRELPTIKEYMQKKYSFTAPKKIEPESDNEPLKKDGSATESMINRRGVVGQNYGVHKSTLEMPVETTFEIGYSKKPTSYGLFAENDNSGIAVNAKMSEELSYEKPPITYTNYSAESGTIQHKANSEHGTNFDYNTTLSYSQEYDSRVEALQKRLVDLDYLNVSDDEWGYFGNKTQAAVNAYKENNDLGNDGEYNGVVGKETWESLGLKCISEQDIANGLKIVTEENGVQLYDVTIPFNNLLEKVKKEGNEHKYNFILFYTKVNSDMDYDIKTFGAWMRTMQISYPGSFDSVVVYNDNYTSPEELGNFLYGYYGNAMGLPENVLLAGSIYASGIWKESKANGIYNEFMDHIAIKKGFDYYEKQNK